MSAAVESLRVRREPPPPPPPIPTPLIRILTDEYIMQAAAERIVLDPKYHDILAVVKAARNGAVYGTKVRFPHALVYAP